MLLECFNAKRAASTAEFTMRHVTTSETKKVLETRVDYVQYCLFAGNTAFTANPRKVYKLLNVHRLRNVTTTFLTVHITSVGFYKKLCLDTFHVLYAFLPY